MCWLVSLLTLAACDKTGSTGAGKPYRLLVIKDPGNHTRTYAVLSNHLMGISMRHYRSLTPQQLTREKALTDSLFRRRTSPEVRNQLARLKGFNNALHQDTLIHQLQLARQEVLKTNPSFLAKSLRAQTKWLLLAQTSNRKNTTSPE